MIRSFEDRDAERLWCGEAAARLRGFARPALRHLEILNAAASLNNLRRIPRLRLRRLVGDPDQRFSLAIDDRRRLLFVWRNGNAFRVAIVDAPDDNRPAGTRP